MSTALTIAGSDSSGGAGIQADLRTFTALEVYGFSAITAITAQEKNGITAVHHVPPDVILNQITAALDSTPKIGVKTGMLGTCETVDTVCKIMRERSIRPVVDPVITSSSGTALLADDAIEFMIEDLFPIASVVTPNIEEVEKLIGTNIRTASDAKKAAKRIGDLGPQAVVITGGHLNPENDTVVDFVFDGQMHHEIFSPRAHPMNPLQSRGTGCTYTAALLARLTKGDRLVKAAQFAQTYVARILSIHPISPN